MRTNRCISTLPFGPAFPPFLVRWRADDELSRWRDDDQGLSLTVHEPAAVSHRLAGGELPIDPLEFCLTPPLPQRPGNSPVNPGVRIVGVQIEQPRSQPLAFDRWQLLFAELPQNEDQGAANRNLTLGIQLSQNLMRVRIEGTETGE